MKKFNRDEYTNEFMFNLQCNGEKYHLEITEGLFVDCQERAWCQFTKEEILTLINFLNNLKDKYIEEK